MVKIYGMSGIIFIMTKSKDNPDDFSNKPFKDLRNIIDKKGIQIFNSQLKSTEECLSDEELFALAMKQVQEIKEFRMLKTCNKKLPQRFPKIDPDKETIDMLNDIIEGKAKINLRDTQEYVEWLNPKYANFYRRDIPRRLHEKKFSVQDYIDLHGFTVDEAEKAVDTFIKESLKQGIRCIKFIHGRGLRSPIGAPVIKEALIKWLTGRYHKYVIAFATASQNDGGLGAMYVLLRDRKAP